MGVPGGSVVTTLVTLALIAAAAWLALRVAGRRRHPTALRLLASLPLGARQGVSVVEVCGRVLVLGTGEGAPRLITELEPASAQALATPERAEAGRPAWLTDEGAR
jgi:flagellar biosynthetic protein FliO